MTHLKFEEVVESASCSFSQMLFNACLKCKKIAHRGAVSCTVGLLPARSFVKIFTSSTATLTQ